jgi:hypothetical protein
MGRTTRTDLRAGTDLVAVGRAEVLDEPQPVVVLLDAALRGTAHDHPGGRDDVREADRNPPVRTRADEAADAYRAALVLAPGCDGVNQPQMFVSSDRA